MKRFLLITMIALLTLVFVGCSCEFTTLYYDVTFYSANGIEITTLQIQRNKPLTLPTESDLKAWVADNEELNELGITYPTYYSYDSQWRDSEGRQINFNDYKRVRSNLKIYGTILLDDGNLEKLSVTFNAGEHGAILDGALQVSKIVKEVSYGKSVIPPTVIAHEDYEFIGWDCQNSKFDVVTASFTAKALYRYIGDIRVTFNAGEHGMLLDGAEKVSVLIKKVVHGDNVAPPTVVADENYEFIGWDCANAKFNNVTANFTATALYKFVGEVAVTFNAGEFGMIYNNGTLVSEVTIYVEYGSNITPPTVMANEGYNFIGWDCGSAAFNNVTSHFTAIALYSAADTVTVTFDAGDGGHFGNGVKVSYLTTEVGGTITPPEVTVYPGYTFTGWATDGYSFENVTESFTATAIYDVDVFTVVFHAGEFGMFADGEKSAQITVTYGTILSLQMFPEVFAISEAYQFEGWGIISSEPVHEDRQYIADWSIKTFTVTFYNGTEIFGTKYVAYGETADDPGVPKKDYHTFTGWDKSYSNVTENLEIYAEYRLANVIHEFYHESKGTENLIERVEYVYGSDITDILTRMNAATDLYARSLGEGFYFNGWQYETVFNYAEDGNLISISYVWVATYTDQIYYAVTFWYEDAEGNRTRLGEIYLVSKGYVFDESLLLGLLTKLLGENDFEFEYFDNDDNDASYIFDNEGEGVNRTMDIIIRIK